jgi:hypothetical protein
MDRSRDYITRTNSGMRRLGKEMTAGRYSSNRRAAFVLQPLPGYLSLHIWLLGIVETHISSSYRIARARDGRRVNHRLRLWRVILHVGVGPIVITYRRSNGWILRDWSRSKKSAARASSSGRLLATIQLLPASVQTLQAVI